MNMDDLGQLNDLQNIVDLGQAHDDDNDWEMLDGVLRGSTAFTISNHGGELSDVLDKLAKDCQKIKR